MVFLTFLLTGATLAAVRPESDPAEARSAARAAVPAIVVEGPAAPRWTIAPDPGLTRRYAPPPYRQRRGIVIRF